MLKQWLIALFLVSAPVSGLLAQAITPLDKSPMDMCFFPANYPILKIQNKVTEPLLARIIYSRPQKNGRAVFGELVEYGKVWRLGANESTEIELYKDAKIGDAKVKKGRYSMYGIPYQDKWTIILNRETDSWGAFQYNPQKDVLRIDIKTEKQQEPAEAFTMQFEKTPQGTGLVILWDSTKVQLPIAF